MTDPKQGWKALSFRDNEDVPAGTAEARTTHIRQRAMEKFGLHETDINQDVVPAYSGTMSLRNIENGGMDTLHVFEMQISAAAAARLNAIHNPDVLYAGDIPQQRAHALGAFDPRKLPKGPRIKW